MKPIHLVTYVDDKSLVLFVAGVCDISQRNFYFTKTKYGFGFGFGSIGYRDKLRMSKSLGMRENSTFPNLD